MRRSHLLIIGSSLALAGCGLLPGADTVSATPSAGSSQTPGTAMSQSPEDLAAGCVADIHAALNDEQRVAQLLMVGLDANASPSSLDALIGDGLVGNVVYLGGWQGAEKVKAASDHLQAAATKGATGEVGLLIAADQEGGQVHQLRAPGFTQPPSALEQAKLPAAQLTKAATGWAKEMSAAGVNVNLAPVADTVPTSIGKANEPIGRWGRQYGSDPKVVAESSTAFIKGMTAGGVQSTTKHFPGLGRIRGNTDFTAEGTTDSVTTAEDPYLEPFAADIKAGANLVMVSSARYDKLDPDNPAMFSSPVITDLLRGTMGYDGVVITDDLNAVALKSYPPAERATKLLAAGGDIALTGDPSVAAAMSKAIIEQAMADEEFGELVDSSVTRVLKLKEKAGLLPCSASKP